MSSKLVFNVANVVPFTIKGFENAFVSRMLLDQHNVGSQKVVVNHFILRPGISLSQSVHPPGFDEICYILSGTGTLYLYAHDEPHRLESGTVAFIPGDTIHSLENLGAEDLVMLTVMPGPLAEGANPLYDARKAEWGTTFRLETEPAGS